VSEAGDENEQATTTALAPGLPRRVRADARRNIDLVLEAAKAEFAAVGVDAPMKAIADRAGVGVGTLYRHYPQRADLIAAVFRREIDSCAAEAEVLTKELPAVNALAQWLDRYTAFLATKRGLASALHSGDPAYEALPQYFGGRMIPVLGRLLDAAAAVGGIRGDIDALHMLHAVNNLCVPLNDEEDASSSRRMVSVLVDGLRYGIKNDRRTTDATVTSIIDSKCAFGASSAGRSPLSA
jgi:AcrR family transcriptional regulator